MADNLSFTEEEMMVDEGTGYPKAYARLCGGDGKFRLYHHGPPSTFLPYSLQPGQDSKLKSFDELFPIIDPKARPTTKPKLFVSLLWKQLSHIGSAGFDPAIFRVDTYGNVLYYHADSASPLAWDVDHWFSCSRGGLTVPSNLRIVQKQVCKRKHNKLEFQLPWWDLQLGISVNQFLSIFASSNSDFRHRAFTFLFSEGENEELNDSQTVDSHMFPQHFIESQEQVGLAPAAIVLSRREAPPTFKSLDHNGQPRPSSPIIAARKFKHDVTEGNEIPNMVTNPYQAIVMARDSLKHKEETTKMLGEIQKLDDEVNEMRVRNENERMTIQELELMLIKRKRRAEKCRRLSEAQSSYRTMLEKMIRDAMHQSVIYKEQVRLNQAATNALMARLEAQKAICDASEKELHKKFNQREEIEKQIRPEGEQARKRSRLDESSSSEENANQTLLSLPGARPITPRPRASLERREEETVLALKGSKPCTPILRVDNKFIKERYDQACLSLEPSKLTMSAHKELRKFLEEEQKASEAGLSLNADRDRLLKKVLIEEKNDTDEENLNNISLMVDLDSEAVIDDELQKLVIREGSKNLNIRIPVFEEEPDKAVEDEESKRLRGKGHVEKWLHMLLENSQGQGGDLDNKNSNENGEEIEEVDKENLQQNIQGRHVEQKTKKIKAEAAKLDEFVKENDVQQSSRGRNCEKIKKDGGKVKAEKFSALEVRSSRTSFDGNERCEKGVISSESARSFWPIPTSPSMILSVRKGVDRIRRRQ